MPLSAVDRLDIRELLVRYELASRVDEGDERGSYLAIFTEDAVLDGARGYYEGIEGILAFDRMVRSTDGTVKARTRHTNFLIEGDGDRATMKACWYKLKPRDGRAPEVVTGDYECVVVRVDGSWKMKQRIVRVDGVPQWKDTDHAKAGKHYVLHGDRFVLEDIEP